MSDSSSWRVETEGRLRKAQVSLEAARALIERKPPCIDDSVNRASAAALQAARALVDARWPPRSAPPHDPTWRPGMAKPEVSGPYSKASWPVIVQQFEKASGEMALPFDIAAYLRALVEDGHLADVGDTVTYEPDEAFEAVATAEKVVSNVTKHLPLAFALGDRDVPPEPDPRDDHDENATTLEVMPLSATDPALQPVPLPAPLGARPEEPIALPPTLPPLPVVRPLSIDGAPSADLPAAPPAGPDKPAAVVASEPMVLDDQHSRRAPRVSHEVMVAVRGEQIAFTSWGTNLSATGVFVNTHTPAASGDEVSLLLQLPGVPECKLRGRVAWVKAPGEQVDQPGMGVQFLEIDEPTRALLAQMVARLTADLSTPPAA